MHRRTLGIIAFGLLTASGPLSAPLSAQAVQGPGTISVEAEPAQPEVAASVPAFVEALGTALAARGFTLLDGPGHAALVADLQLTRSDLGMTRAKGTSDKGSVSPGAGPAVGVGAAIPLRNGASRDVPLQQTRLTLQVKRRGETAPLWQGTAITVRAGDTARGSDPTVATDLVAALLQIYPNPPRGVISVP